jgi:hypothetical protein
VIVLIVPHPHDDLLAGYVDRLLKHEPGFVLPLTAHVHLEGPACILAIINSCGRWVRRLRVICKRVRERYILAVNAEFNLSKNEVPIASGSTSACRQRFVRQHGQTECGKLVS